MANPYFAKCALQGQKYIKQREKLTMYSNYKGVTLEVFGRGMLQRSVPSVPWDKGALLYGVNP